MKIIESGEEMREYSQQLKQARKTIGLLDTTGGLHDGHMSLVKIAKDNVDVVIVSIDRIMDYTHCSREEYKTQLKVYEDVDLKKDADLCELNNVDVLFIPLMDDLYPDSPTIHLDPLPLNVQNFLQNPPIHMKFIFGAKELYNITLPDISILGQKDIYQTFVLKSLIHQLNLPIKVTMTPIVRDFDGLAFSSRNQLLTPLEREDATSIYQTLHEISRWTSYPPVAEIKKHIISRITNANGSVNYLDICCAETLEELDLIDRKFVIIVDVFFGEIQLGDNIIIEP